MILDLGNLKIGTTPLCDKYKVSGNINGFYNKSEIINILSENKLTADLTCLEDKSNDMLVWELTRDGACTSVHAFIDVNNKIIESKIKIRPHRVDVEILENINGIKRLKLEEDIKDIIINNDFYDTELNTMSNTFEAKVRLAIAMEIGDVTILCDAINNDGTHIKEAYIPISLGEYDDHSPVVLARVCEENGIINISDVEDKVLHLMMYEGIRPFRRIKERVRRKRDLNYRKTAYKGSLDKRTITGSTNMKNKITPNRGRHDGDEDESEPESDA